IVPDRDAVLPIRQRVALVGPLAVVLEREGAAAGDQQAVQVLLRQPVEPCDGRAEPVGIETDVPGRRRRPAVLHACRRAIGHWRSPRLTRHCERASTVMPARTDRSKNRPCGTVASTGAVGTPAASSMSATQWEHTCRAWKLPLAR